MADDHELDDLPLNNHPVNTSSKPPEGISSLQMAGRKSGVELFEEENAAIAGEDLTVVLQMPDREVQVQMKMGHTVELLKHRAREALDDLSLQLEMRLTKTDQVMIDPLSLNDYPIAGEKIIKVKVSIL